MTLLGSSVRPGFDEIIAFSSPGVRQGEFVERIAAGLAVTRSTTHETSEYSE
jgi:hypothetical protein